MAPDAAASRREREFLDVAALVGDLLAGREIEAEQGYQRALAMYPSNPRARAGLEAPHRAGVHVGERGHVNAPAEDADVVREPDLAGTTGAAHGRG